MPRFARYIRDGMLARGHQVDCWTSKIILGKLAVRSNFIRKWLGYIDQFAIFPRVLRKRVRQTPPDHLFVVVDQALGMWVPYLQNRPLVIHCMDFLALRSALGEFPENPTRWTGKQYQRLIRNGFSNGRHFLSISKNTQTDLHRLSRQPIVSSEVAYIGLNSDFSIMQRDAAISQLAPFLSPSEKDGFLLHVGGNPWYKNREGVIEIYRAWCKVTSSAIPLWMIGSPPTDSLRKAANNVPNGGHVRFLDGLSDVQVRSAYNLTKLFLFPSLEEGFGWPIAEALACGALVLTTGHAPMTEVGGDAVEYLSRRPFSNRDEWAREGATKIAMLLGLSDSEKQSRQALGFEQANKFSTDATLDRYEEHYQRILRSYGIET
jgi:glycosyltransferase involved in cell wall biosynthesis